MTQLTDDNCATD